MIKKLLVVFIVSLTVANLFILAIPQKAFAANSDPAKALTRRRLHTFLFCLNTESLNMGNLKSYDDLYKGPATALLGGPEWVVVGFDRDSSNGVMGCSTVVRQGMHALGVSDTDADAWLLKELTGNSDFSSGEQKIDATKLSNLVRRVTAAKDAVESPSGDLRRERILPLAKVCYEMKPTAVASGFDFKESGNFFFRKSESDIKDYALGSFVRGETAGFTDLYNKTAWIGNIKLDGWSGNGYGFGDSFYPIGSDIEQTKGYEFDAILSCQYITDNHEWLFQNVSINDNGDFVLPGGKAVGAPPQSTGGSGSIKGALECDNGGIFGFIHNPLNWLLCPFANGLKEAMGKYDDEIVNLLKLPTERLFDREGNKKTVAEAFHTAWSNFRIIAMAFLVLIALIMIISQAIAVGPFDAYTIKHVMPRLLIAVILISLSWDLMRYAVDLSNILGLGIRGLIFTPFKDFRGAIDLNIGGVGLFGVAGTASLALLGPFGVLLLALTGIIAVLTALLVLILREMLVMFLVIVAPIAIVSSILPNTQKVWKMWTSYFSRALLLFVLFSAVVATGHAFAVMSTTLHRGTLGTIFAFIAYFGPYFMLPTIFKMSGGAIAAISGAAYGATQGIRGGLKSARRKQVAKRTQEYGQKAAQKRFFKSGTDKNFTGRLNRALQTASLLPKAGLRPSKFKERLDAARSSTGSAMSAKLAQESAAVQAVAGNDDLLQAALHGAGTDADARKYLKDLGQTDAEVDENAALIEQAKRDVGFENFAEFASVANAGTGTGYKNGPADMLATINRVAGGDRAKAGRMLAAAREQATKARRADLYGCGFTTSADMMGQMYRTDPTGTSTSNATKNFVNQTMTGEAVRTKSMGELASSRGDSFRNLAPALARRMAGARGAVDKARANFAAGTGTEEQVAEAEHEQKRILAHTSALVDYASAISEENAQVGGALLREGSGQMVDVFEERPVMNGDTPALDEHMKPIMERVKTGERELMISEQMEYLEGDAEFKNYKKTIVTSEAGRAGQVAAQAATAGGIPPPGIPPVPGAPGP